MFIRFLLQGKYFVHSIVFGQKNLFATNAIVSASIGFLGDAIQQNYEIYRRYSKRNLNKSNRESDLWQEICEQYNWVRASHMAIAGLTTGVATHYWYRLLERFYPSKQNNLWMLFKLVLVDQIIYSPFNLLSKYFSPLLGRISSIYSIEIILSL
ncbi:hypothetical protein NH340_JMT08307 [Sarcoptes scabiei]|nr:hypothetical protein NH340_JMT08307 [Sarcoptes scabiei]